MAPILPTFSAAATAGVVTVPRAGVDAVLGVGAFETEAGVDSFDALVPSGVTNGVAAALLVPLEALAGVLLVAGAGV